MCADQLTRVLVVGSGLMGSGIAQVCAQSGYRVDMIDVAQPAVDAALAAIDKSLVRLVRSGKLDQAAADAARSAISSGTDLQGPAIDADIVIEAVTEDFDVKAGLFRQLDKICPERTVFATNTSQFSITSLAEVTSRPERFIGTHWMNPVPVMRLVEVVRGEQTSDATLAATLTLIECCGKEHIVCRKDTQGFVTSRLLLMLNLEAVRIYEEGIASVDDINKACVLAFNHALGPLATLDLGGLDTALFAGDAMRQHYGDRFLPPQTLRRLVNAGALGRKTGVGFGDYREAVG